MALNQETLNLIHNYSGGEQELSPDLFAESVSEAERAVLQRAAEFVSAHFDQAREKGIVRGGHDYDHSRRTAGYAAAIALSEGQSPFVPVLTALLIDVGRAVDDPRSANWQHGFLSAEIADPFLRSVDIIDDDTRAEILEAVCEHPRFNNPDDKPLTVLIKDADKLDSAGLNGFARSAAHRHMLPVSGPIDGLVEEKGYKTIIDDYKGLLEWFTDPRFACRTEFGKRLASLRFIQFKQVLDGMEAEVQANEELFSLVIKGK